MGEIGATRPAWPVSTSRNDRRYLPFPSITQSRNDVDSCVNAVRSLAKTRPSPLVVETEVTISRGAIGGHSTLAPPIARDSSNQSSPPGMQRAVGYKMHCSFVSPIPFNYAVQKGRRIVSECGVSATKTRQYHPESRTRVTISEAATQGYSTVAPPTDLNYSATT